jgi:PAS domain S-box-containing protein
VEAKRVQAEAALREVNRALKTLSECNQTLVRATDESGLLHDICRILVEIGGYRLAWVGFAEQDEEKSVRPVAQVGHEEGYLDTLNITWADTRRGRGPTGTAIRTGKPIIVRNILIDPDYAPWRAEATKRGYAASIALPLVANGQTLGALNIYAVEADAFAEDEVKLLGELTDDLAYGIRALRTRAGRERAEETLRTSEEKYRTLVDNIQDGVFVIQDAKMQFINGAFARMLGYTVEEVTGMDFRQLIAPEDLEMVADRYRRRQAGEDVFSEYEFRMLHKDGVSRVIVNMNVGLVDYQSRVASMGTVKDITEQIRAREALREAEEKYRMIVEDQTELISRSLPAGTRTFVNEAYCQYFGKTREELLGQRFTSFTLKEDLEKVEKGLASLSQDSPVITLENRVVAPNGEIRWVQWTDRAQFDAQGNLVAYQSVGRDITGRKQAADALRRERDLAEALAEATAALTATLDFEQVLDGILEQLGRVVPNDAANIMLIEGDQARIVRGRGYERFGTEGFVATVVYRISEVRNLRQMLESRDPVVILDTATYPG